MQDVFVALIFGFGLASISLMISVIGILKDKYWLVIIGAVLFTPFSYYLFGISSANGFALLPLLFHMLSAAAVHEKNLLWACLMLAPSSLVTIWVLFVVLLYQIR